MMIVMRSALLSTMDGNDDSEPGGNVCVCALCVCVCRVCVCDWPESAAVIIGTHKYYTIACRAVVTEVAPTSVASLLRGSVCTVCALWCTHTRYTYTRTHRHTCMQAHTHTHTPPPPAPTHTHSLTYTTWLPQQWVPDWGPWKNLKPRASCLMCWCPLTTNNRR